MLRYQSSHAFAHSHVQCPTPTTIHTCSHVHIHILTSLGHHLCHITDHTCLCWHPLFCTIVLAVHVATSPIALTCSHLFSMYRTCHVTDHICMCSCTHSPSFNHYQQFIFAPSIQYTFVFDNIPSTTSSIAQPPHRSERTSICKFVAPQSCLQLKAEAVYRHGMGFFFLLLMLMVIFIFSLPSFPFIVLHCHTTSGPILGLWSASLANVPP